MVRPGGVNHNSFIIMINPRGVPQRGVNENLTPGARSKRSRSKRDPVYIFFVCFYVWEQSQSIFEVKRAIP